MIELRQGTIATVNIGPFVDQTDGNTEEVALTITQADVLLSKNGGAFTQKTEATSATHDDGGYYQVALDTTDTGTLGSLKLKVHMSGALYVFDEFMVVSQDYYDGKYGANLNGFKADVSALALEASVQAIVQDIFDYAIETGYPFEDTMRIIVSAMAGKSTNGGTYFRNLLDTKNVIESIVDANNNRTNVVLSGV